VAAGAAGRTGSEGRGAVGAKLLTFDAEDASLCASGADEAGAALLLAGLAAALDVISGESSSLRRNMYILLHYIGLVE
jgi:hypothetical protein